MSPEPFIVRSKVVVPATSALLHRPRVVEALEGGLRVRLTLVSAPAGYGKTSSLIDFAVHTGMPVCWYTADERDRDLGTLIHYLVAAIAERFPGFGDRTQATLEELAANLFRDPGHVAEVLANEIADVAEPFILVLDNFEAVDGAYGLRTFLDRLLEVLPANCHVMIGSRVLPEVPVTRLVAKRQLVGLTARDLQFTAEEIRQLLGLSGIHVSKAQAEALARRTEGWITGVLLLGDLLRNERAPGVVGEGRVDVETYAYLANEVLERQPPDIQYFLHVSSVLREMSFRACRGALGLVDAPALLAEVERRNLFVTRFGEGAGAIYRYHALFRDFLHEQLRHRDPTLYRELHQQAAEWFAKQDDIDETVYHYAAAGLMTQAVGLLDQVAMEWFTRGRTETLLQWAEQLPDAMKAQAPRLMLFQSRLLTDRYDYEGARKALAFAEAGFKARGDRLSLAKVYNQRATINLFVARYEEAEKEARAALSIVEKGEIVERANAQRHIGRAYIGLGQLERGIEALQEALVLFREAGSAYDVVNLLQDLTLAMTAQGRLDEAAALLGEALSVARQLGAPAQLAGVLNNLGCLHYDRGEYDQAMDLFAEGLAVARTAGSAWLEANILAGLADLYRDVGAYDRAEPLYNAAWQIAWESEPGLAFHILVSRAEMYRRLGDRTRAFALLGHARQLVGAEHLQFEARGLLPLTEGMLLIEEGQMDVGIGLLQKAVDYLRQQGAIRELARGRLLLARGYQLTGQEAQALEELKEVLRLAKELGTYQFAVVEGRHTEDLLELGASRGLEGCRALSEQVARLKAFGERLLHPRDSQGERVQPRLEIYTLGGGRVVKDGREITASDWQAAMARELFLYIALHGPVERDAIGLVFWPDLSTKKMVDNFHSTLYRVRRAVGAETIVLREGRYQLGDVDCWFDVDEFEGLVARARLLPPHDWRVEDLLRRAIDLYRGDFLPEVDRLWAVPKREGLREMFLDALVGLGRCFEVRKEYDEAVEWYKRALDVDPLREDIHRRIMECYSAAGRRAEAAAQYRVCQETLISELGVEPSLETRELYERIVGGAD